MLSNYSEIARVRFVSTWDASQLHPRKLTCPLETGISNRKGSSSQALFFRDMIVFGGFIMRKVWSYSFHLPMLLRTDVKNKTLTSTDFSPHFGNLRNPSRIAFTFKEFWRWKHLEFRSSLVKKTAPGHVREPAWGDVFPCQHLGRLEPFEDHPLLMIHVSLPDS